MKTDKIMEKKFITKEIFRKSYNENLALIPFGDIPSYILPTDKIHIEYDEGYFSESNSWDAHTDLVISREVLETDEEFDKRMLNASKEYERMKTARYEHYLKLKKEFDV
jgi:hypothetical protein